jgi:hypothetical protein
MIHFFRNANRILVVTSSTKQRHISRDLESEYQRAQWMYMFSAENDAERDGALRVMQEVLVDEIMNVEVRGLTVDGPIGGPDDSCWQHGPGLEVIERDAAEHIYSMWDKADVLIPSVH